MDHFSGVTPEERWKNDVLNEVRHIRQCLERIAQASEPNQIELPMGNEQNNRRGRQKRSAG